MRCYRKDICQWSSLANGTDRDKLSRLATTCKTTPYDENAWSSLPPACVILGDSSWSMYDLVSKIKLVLLVQIKWPLLYTRRQNMSVLWRSQVNFNLAATAYKSLFSETRLIFYSSSMQSNLRRLRRWRRSWITYGNKKEKRFETFLFAVCLLLRIAVPVFVIRFFEVKLVYLHETNFFLGTRLICYVWV